MKKIIISIILLVCVFFIYKMFTLPPDVVAMSYLNKLSKGDYEGAEQSVCYDEQSTFRRDFITMSRTLQEYKINNITLDPKIDSIILDTAYVSFTNIHNENKILVKLKKQNKFWWGVTFK